MNRARYNNDLRPHFKPCYDDVTVAKFLVVYFVTIFPFVLIMSTLLVLGKYNNYYACIS